MLIVKVVLALDKFKGTFSSTDAANCVADGIRRRNPNIEVTFVPMADGGEGTSKILALQLGFDALHTKINVRQNIMQDVTIYWHNSRRIALVESASVLGYGSICDSISEEFFFKSSSAPLGQLIKKAFDLRPQEIWIAIGGTLTADAGWGLAAEFGLKALDSRGNLLIPCLKNMPNVASLHCEEVFQNSLRRIKFIGLCDVNAPAAPVAPISLNSFLIQKGAPPDAILEVEHRILKFSNLLQESFPNTFQNSQSFSGAGGGLCFGLSAMCSQFHAESGAARVAHACQLESLVRDADLVVCGEGGLNLQSLYGKAPFIVAQIAQKTNKPIWGVFGSCDNQSVEIKNKLNLCNMSVLFQKKPHSASELVRQSKMRLVETGIAIAHWLEMSAFHSKHST